jgi:hypothetical protein
MPVESLDRLRNCAAILPLIIVSLSYVLHRGRPEKESFMSGRTVAIYIKSPDPKIND